MWWLFHPIDSIIGSFAFSLPSTYLNYPFSFHYLVLFFMFGSKVRYPDDDSAPLYVGILRVETLCFSIRSINSFMCLVSRLDLCGGYSTLLIV